MSADLGLLGGELMGDHTLTVMNPHGLIDHWEKQARMYGWKYYTQFIPDTGAQVFFLATEDDAVFLWIWSKER